MGERLQRKHKMDEKREGGLRALWSVDDCVYEIIERWLVGWLVGWFFNSLVQSFAPHAFL